MKFTYTCRAQIDGNWEEWIGEITLLRPFNGTEYEINARGSSFHLVIGRHTQSRYIYIPTWDIAMDISYLNDRFWNKEQLRFRYPELSEVDVTSIVESLVAIHEYTNE